MADAVRHITFERGLDPRDFTLIAYGGAGPLHAAAVARELAIRTVVIPQAPGHFSALGMLMADLRRDHVQALFERLHDLSLEELEAQFQQLEATGREALKASGIATDRMVFERAKLLQGNVIEGPALIEEEASVTVLGPEDCVHVNAFGHLIMRLGGMLG